MTLKEMIEPCDADQLKLLVLVFNETVSAFEKHMRQELGSAVVDDLISSFTYPKSMELLRDLLREVVKEDPEA